MSFVRTTVGVLLTSAARAPLALATSVILARWLSVEDRGLYAVATAVALTASLLLQLGWNSATIYQLRRLRVGASDVASIALTVVFVLSLAGLGVAWLARSYLLQWFMPGATVLLLALALARVPARLLGGVFTGMARGLARFDLLNGYHLAIAFGTLATVAAVLFASPGELHGLLGAIAVLEWLVALVVVGMVLRLTGARLGVSWRALADGQRFGLKSYLQMLSGRLHERLDVFLLAYFIQDPVPIAYYAIARSVIQQVHLLPDALSNVLFPTLAGMGNRDAAAFTSRVSRHAVAWMGLTAALLLLVAPFLIPVLYGAAYAAAVAPFLILLPGAAFFMVHRVLARYFTAIDRQQVNLATQAPALLVNVGLNLLLIPRFGILGAATANLCSYMLEALLMSIAYLGLTGRSFSETFLLTQEDLQGYKERLATWLRTRRPADLSR